VSFHRHQAIDCPDTSRASANAALRKSKRRQRLLASRAVAEGVLISISDSDKRTPQLMEIYHPPSSSLMFQHADHRHHLCQGFAAAAASTMWKEQQQQHISPVMSIADCSQEQHCTPRHDMQKYLSPQLMEIYHPPRRKCPPCHASSSISLPLHRIFWLLTLLQLQLKFFSMITMIIIR